MKTLLAIILGLVAVTAQVRGIDAVELIIRINALRIYIKNKCLLINYLINFD